ncbi:MAG: hypothetical protein AAF558_05515 [Verrucomicrobiota bacterium]
MESAFEKLLVHLIENEIEFLVVGGLAVALNGYPRMTEDVDIWINPRPENIQNLLRALASYGEGFGGTLSPEDFVDEPGAIRVIEEFPIDIFVQMNGISYAEIHQHRKIHKTALVSIPYVDAEGLIRIKSGSHREKDILDVSILNKLK